MTIDVYFISNRHLTDKDIAKITREIKKSGILDKYLIIRDNLLPTEIADVICKIQGSKEFAIDDLSHIVIKGTDTRVGYIGDESLQLYNCGIKKLFQYHQDLLRFYR